MKLPDLIKWCNDAPDYTTRVSCYLMALAWCAGARECCRDEIGQKQLDHMAHELKKRVLQDCGPELVDRPSRDDGEPMHKSKRVY